MPLPFGGQVMEMTWFKEAFHWTGHPTDMNRSQAKNLGLCFRVWQDRNGLFTLELEHKLEYGGGLHKGTLDGCKRVAQVAVNVVEETWKREEELTYGGEVQPPGQVPGVREKA